MRKVHTKSLDALEDCDDAASGYCTHAIYAPSVGCDEQLSYNTDPAISTIVFCRLVLSLSITNARPLLELVLTVGFGLHLENALIDYDIKHVLAEKIVKILVAAKRLRKRLYLSL